MDHERYLWAVARYIEQNPVRAGIIEKAEDYSYSSARAHVKGSNDAVLGEELFTKDRREDYVLLLRSDISKKEIERLRYATKTGRPFGNEEFVVEMENKLERNLFFAGTSTLMLNKQITSNCPQPPERFGAKPIPFNADITMSRWSP